MKEQILKFIKDYPTRPYYTLRLQLQACKCNVYVNGIPVTTFNVNGGLTSEIPLNNFILKSGQQQLRIELLPFEGQNLLSKQTDCEAEIGLSFATGPRKLENYQRVANFKLEESTKQKQLPLFLKELLFTGSVPWDYSNRLAGAKQLPEGKALDALVRDGIYNLYNSMESRNISKYQAIITPSIAKESDVLYRTSEDIDFIVKNSDFSYLKELNPLSKYYTKTYCNNKIVQLVGEQPDKNGNFSVLTYAINPLQPGGRNGFAREDYLYYLPAGEKMLQIF